MEDNELYIDIRESDEIENNPSKQRRDLFIPMFSLLDNYDTLLDKNKKYVLFCLAGSRAQQTADALRRKGITNVRVGGGITD